MSDRCTLKTERRGNLLSLTVSTTMEWVEEIKQKYGQDPKLLQLQEQCVLRSLNPHYSVREGLLF